MVLAQKDLALFLVVGNDEIRDYLVNLLREHNHAPLVVSDIGESLQALDCESVLSFGPGIYSRIKVACPYCRIVLLCDKSHEEHRELIREAMEIGIYACLLAPFEGWEVLAMVRRHQGRKPAKKRPSRKKSLS